MEFLIRLVVPITILAAFAFACRRLPASLMKPPEGGSQYIPYGGTWYVNFCIVAVGALFAVCTHALLVWLSRFIATIEGPAEILLWPQTATWWIFPGFGAITLSWEIVLQLWSAFGNRAAAYSYSYWWAQTAGFDSTAMLRWIAVLIVLPMGVLTILALPMHVALGKDEIRDCGYAFSRCQVYRYVDARRMTEIEGARNRYGTLIRRAGIVIDFTDGWHWSSADIGDFKETVDPALADFLQRKTHLSLNYAQSQVDIPPIDSRP